MGALADHISETPRFWLVAGLALGTFAIDVTIIFVSWVRLRRQKRAQLRAVGGDWHAVAALKTPSRLPEVIAALLPLAIAATSARLIRQSENVVVTALDLGDLSQQVPIIAKGMGGAINGIEVGLLAVLLTALAGGLAVALAISARLRAVGLRRAESLAARADDASAWLKFPGPKPAVLVAAIGAFVVLGLAPLARAASPSMWSMGSYSAIGSPFKDAGERISAFIDYSSERLDQAFLVARAGVAIATLIAAYLAWRFSPARARAGVPGGSRPVHREGFVAPVVALTVIAVAAAGFMAARPMREENALPWPPYDSGERLLVDIATPDLEGPDDVERAPVIQVTPNAMGLEGSQADASEISVRLDTLRKDGFLWLHHPYNNGEVIVACQADTKIDRISDVLRACVAARTPHVTFAFLRRRVADRPMLGHRWGNRARAARTTAVESKADVKGSGTTILSVASFPTCAALSQEIVNARRAGHEVALVLPPRQ